MDIIRLCPVFKNYIWGGEKLKEQFGYDTGFAKTAEAWVLSTHKDGMCKAQDGTPLCEIVKKYGGTNCKKFADFPVLIKLIDARDNLSVQVHPNNEYAQKHENEFGKTEAWYVIDAEDDAQIIFGFKDKITKQEFNQSIENNTLLDKLNSVSAKKGDVFFIEAGTVHAIGKGLLIAEVQQNSNCTYRVYDHGRVDENGNARPLHIKKALDVAICNKPNHNVININNNILKQSVAKCEYFNTTKYIVEKEISLNANNESFNHILVLNGDGEIDGIKINKGDSIFIPAGYGEYKISGNIEILKTKI